MTKGAPNGYFAQDMIIFGSLEKDSRAAKGFLLHPPDLRGAGVSALNERQDKIRAFLASLGEGASAQFQWTVNSDYERELSQYEKETRQCAIPFVREVRQERYRRFQRQMERRQLRREQLLLFIAFKMEAYSGNLKSRRGLQAFYRKQLEQLKTFFRETGDQLAGIFGPDTGVEAMDDLKHFAYTKSFLNPSLVERPAYHFEEHFDPALTIQENCWDGDGIAHGKSGFYLDGYYHCVFTLKRWPRKTYPGLIFKLTGLPFLDYQITVNVSPLETRREIQSEERQIERLQGEFQEKGRRSLLTAIHKKEAKIDKLSGGFTYPFQVDYILRLWDPSEAGLHAKLSAVKNAINTLNGAQYYENAIPTSAKRLFFASWPGWTGSSYRHRSLYAEDSYLADMLPFSSTFTGYLEGAEALYDGSQNNLVGLKTFVNGVPQHAVLLGTSGAGKSVQMEDLLSQTGHLFPYTVIIEEGLSYEHFTRQMGERPMLIHPDGELTLNYLDTAGLPLNQLQVSTAVALLSKMIGETENAEAQQVRQAQIAQYIHQLYEDTFEDWANKHREAIPEIQRMACATYLWRAQMAERDLSVTYLEAYADFRERLQREESLALAFLDRISEEEITRFCKEPDTASWVMRMAFAFFKAQDYPSHSALIELMRFSRLGEHPKEAIDRIATLLSAWTREGQFGKLFDGVTNLRLSGRVAHFELGQIPEQAPELKAATGLLITGFVRQHIISLPRSLRKRIVFEEVGRLLDVPGGEKIVAESYAQLRKFSCVTCSIVQQYSKFKETRIRPVIMGNSKQFLLMRQFDRSDISDIARDINLPVSVQEAIMQYPLIEQQPEGKRFSSVCYFCPSVSPPLCGTVRNVRPQLNANPKQAELVHATS